MLQKHPSARGGGPLLAREGGHLFLPILDAQQVAVPMQCLCHSRHYWCKSGTYALGNCTSLMAWRDEVSTTLSHVHGGIAPVPVGPNPRAAKSKDAVGGGGWGLH